MRCRDNTKLSYIILEGPNGRRKVRENEEYVLGSGESVVGWEPSEAQVKLQQQDESMLLKMVAYFGMEAGDFLKVAGTALGLHCKSCELRYMVTQAVKQLGIIKSVILIAKTIHGLTEEEKQEIEKAFRDSN